MINHQSWIEDLDFVVKNIRNYHPNPYYRITQRDFEALVAEQRKATREARSTGECLVAIMKVVAALRDGHTAARAMYEKLGYVDSGAALSKEL
jgi:myo-inositol catabolism protein IolC